MKEGIGGSLKTISEMERVVSGALLVALPFGEPLDPKDCCLEGKASLFYIETADFKAK